MLLIFKYRNKARKKLIKLQPIDVIISFWKIRRNECEEINDNFSIEPSISRVPTRGSRIGFSNAIKFPNKNNSICGKRSDANFVKLDAKTTTSSRTLAGKAPWSTYRAFYAAVNHRTNVDTSIKNVARIETQIKRVKEKKKRKIKGSREQQQKKKRRKTRVKVLQKVEANRFQFTSLKLPNPFWNQIWRPARKPNGEKGKKNNKRAGSRIKREERIREDSKWNALTFDPSS